MNHILYSVTELQKIIEAKPFIKNPEAAIRTLLTDSRKITDTDHALFFALKGRRDGHSFINDIYQAGVRGFVISDANFDHSIFPDANFYLVGDSLNALQVLAAYHRQKFNYPVIGITGSNGKTVVKEWLFQLLSPQYNIVRSPKSYNSQIGVPLSVWQMTDENNLAIFEAGISKPDEMDRLEKAIGPTIGILTSIGLAHDDGFASTEEKIKEKLKLFKNVDLFIYPLKYLDNYTGKIPGRNTFTWGYDEHADLKIELEEFIPQNQMVKATYNGKEVKAVIPFTDSASIENAITCWATMLSLGYEPDEISKRLAKLLPVEMRLELKNGINNCSIIDDSYSLDLSSLTLALDFLKQQNQHQKKTLILSDFPGENAVSLELYERVAQLLKSKSIDRLIGIGRQISLYANLFPMETTFFSDTKEFLDNFHSLKFSNETVLLKGARIFEFEKVSRLLTQKVHETVLEINLNALEHNLNFYKSQLKPGVKLMAMVKAFSYGSGSFEVANLLEFNRVDYLTVAYADEGVVLRKAGITLPIIVMSPDIMAFETMIENNLEPEIYSIRIFNELLEILSHKDLASYPVHIKLDTGMHRLGFMENEVDELLKLITRTKKMHVKSVFSHLAASGEKEHDDFTKSQIDQFEYLSKRIEKAIGYSFLRHLSNTSGISRWPNAQFDMVRLGIGLYGIDSSYLNGSPLQTVTSLKTRISQIKEIPAGDTVGYSRKGRMPNGGKIATVKIGYADGYNTALGNGVGKMLIKGNTVSTIGKICMDMCMLDITGLDLNEGDEVIVFNDQIRVEDIAKQLNTIPYEVLTSVSQRVKRVYYYE